MSASYDLQGSFDHVALFASWTSVHIFASLVRIETAVTFRIYTACCSPSQYVTELPSSPCLSNLTLSAAVLPARVRCLLVLLR